MSVKRHRTAGWEQKTIDSNWKQSEKNDVARQLNQLKGTFCLWSLDPTPKSWFNLNILNPAESSGRNQ